MLSLLEEMGKIEGEKFRVDALLFRGIDINDPNKSTKSGGTKDYIFKEPSEYENLSEEEKKKATQEIKEKLQGLSSFSKSMGVISK